MRQLVEIRILLMPQNEMVGPAHPWEMCVSLQPLTPKPCLTLDAEVAPIPITLIAKMRSRSEESIRYQRQLRRSRKWLQKRERRSVKMMATTTEDNEDECTALSKSLWKSKSANGLLEARKSVPNARSGSRTTVVRSSVVCSEHPICKD
jgi:hypothetical protein